MHNSSSIVACVTTTISFIQTTTIPQIQANRMTKNQYFKSLEDLCHTQQTCMLLYSLSYKKLTCYGLCIFWFLLIKYSKASMVLHGHLFFFISFTTQAKMLNAYPVLIKKNLSIWKQLSWEPISNYLRRKGIKQNRITKAICWLW